MSKDRGICSLDGVGACVEAGVEAGVGPGSNARINYRTSNRLPLQYRPKDKASSVAGKQYTSSDNAVLVMHSPEILDPFGAQINLHPSQCHSYW